jgi:hypothetical protein
VVEAALVATRRDDLKHGTNAAYVARLRVQRLPGLAAPADATNRF